MNTIGHNLKLTVYGESHGKSIGAVLDGLPSGEYLDWDEVKKEMARRAPGKNTLSTSRKEGDAFDVQSGYFNNATTGTPLAVMIENTNTRSEDYDDLRHLMRPGHADYTGKVRYDGYNDYRGGGHFSGRLTAPLVFAGAVAMQILGRRGIHVGSHILQIHDVQDRPFNPVHEELSRLLSLKNMTLPLLDETRIEAMEQAVAVPAVKGLEFGDGFALAAMTGSESNDSFYYDKDGTVKTRTNHNGGINGGITNGMPLVFRTVIKPTASIGQEQQTVDTDSGKNTTLIVKGRHDPCIVQRAVPVIEAATAWTVLDILLTRGDL